MLDCYVGTGNVGITGFGVVVGNVLSTIVLDSTQQIFKRALISTHGKPLGQLSSEAFVCLFTCSLVCVSFSFYVICRLALSPTLEPNVTSANVEMSEAQKGLEVNFPTAL